MILFATYTTIIRLSFESESRTINVDTYDSLSPSYRPKTGDRIFPSNRPIIFGLTDGKPTKFNGTKDSQPLAKPVFRRLD